MKKNTKEDIIQRFEASCDIQYRCSENGDYKTGNKEQTKLLRIFKFFEENRELAMECLKELLKKESVVVTTKAAAWCIALNENIDESVRILYENSQKQGIGIYRLNAEMTLNVFKARGYLLVYEDQEIRRTDPEKIVEIFKNISI